MSSTTELIDAQLAAFRARDLEQYISHFSPDVTVTNFEGIELMKGSDGLRENYGPLFTNSPQLSVEIRSRIEWEAFVIDLEHLDGFVNPPDPQTFDACCVYRVIDGKIAAMKFLM